MKNKIFKLAKFCIKQNKELIEKKLVIQSFGNVSVRYDANHFLIKPSGVNLNKIKPSDVPLINIKSGKKVLGKLKPSMDTATHLEIYKKYKDIKSITHTHSEYATAWAQASKPIPLIGTTHADYWEKEVPIIKFINKKNINKDYELFTGKMIIENLVNKKINAYRCPGVLVAGHGPFTWGKEVDSSVLNAEILEFIAKTTYMSFQLKIKKKLPKHISNKHFVRKHGKDAYYGQ
ncbi:class II aldolase/adducin family protein [bacterium]|jgi:L-ribulose-5-phosphate 4-epimerase|nr:class II aldolase/adducin family protein [bacterium]